MTSFSFMMGEQIICDSAKAKDYRACTPTALRNISGCFMPEIYYQTRPTGTLNTVYTIVFTRKLQLALHRSAVRSKVSNQNRGHRHCSKLIRWKHLQRHAFSSKTENFPGNMQGYKTLKSLIKTSNVSHYTYIVYIVSHLSLSC